MAASSWWSWWSWLDLLTDSELNDLESEAVLQCAIRGKLLKKKENIIYLFQFVFSFVVVFSLYMVNTQFEIALFYR